MLDERPILTNLKNDRVFVIKKYSLHSFEASWEAQIKAMRAYAQNLALWEL